MSCMWDSESTGQRITSMVCVKREMGYREVLQGKKYYCFEEVDYGITKN